MILDIQRQYAVIDAPCILGLRPTGVELLAKSLRAASLVERLNASFCGIVTPSPYDYNRDEVTKLLNPAAIKDYSLELADAVNRLLDNDKFPIVLGGDCSILIGNALSLRRLGRYGLFFIDGHADFYQPQESPTGEVADMDLGIVSGHGPDILTNIEDLRPLVKEQDIIVFGYRDAEQSAQYGCADIKSSTIMNTFELKYVQSLGFKKAASLAKDKIVDNEISGFWIHLDVDVLDDSIMPAVDYRLPGGISFSELSDLLSLLVGSKKAVGMSVTIFNPTLDKDGSIAEKLVSSIVRGLS